MRANSVFSMVRVLSWRWRVVGATGRAVASAVGITGIVVGIVIVAVAIIVGCSGGSIVAAVASCPVRRSCANTPTPTLFCGGFSRRRDVSCRILHLPGDAAHRRILVGSVRIFSVPV